MNAATDTYLLLWGGSASPTVNKKVLYWAFNHEGKLCGIILPVEAWQELENILKEGNIDSPYLGAAVTSLFSSNPELKIINIQPDYLHEFCYLKDIVYRSRKLPANLKQETAKLIGQLDTNLFVSQLNRTEKREKGEFFTLLPDKTRLEIFYLVQNRKPPAKLDIVIMCGASKVFLYHT